MSNTDKMKALQLTLDKLEKSYGKGTIMKLGEQVIEPTEVISTGSLGLGYRFRCRRLTKR
jgi:recombination protein RecA